MKRRLAMLVAASAVVAAGLFVPASPASAHVDVCAGQGTATTGAGLTYPGLSHAQNTGFGFTFTLGACVLGTKGTLTAGGTVSGWCGLSSGTGIATGGHRFAWIGVGSVLIVTGELVGVVNAAPNALAGQSCTSGANQFLVTGAVALVHCTLLKQKTTATLPLPLPIGSFTVNAKVCVAV